MLMLRMFLGKDSDRPGAHRRDRDDSSVDLPHKRVSIVRFDTKGKSREGERAELEHMSDSDQVQRLPPLTSSVRRLQSVKVACEKATNTLSRIRRTASHAFPIISPDSIHKKRWSGFIFVCIMYTITWTPYKLSFGLSKLSSIHMTVFWWLDMLLDMLYIIDVIINLRTGYYNSQYRIVTDSSKIAKRYAKGLLVIDTVSSVPLEPLGWMAMGQHAPPDLAAIRLIKVLRVLSVLQEAGQEQFGFLNFVERHVLNVHPGSSRMLLLLLRVMLFVHWFACLQWYVAVRFGATEDSWVTKLDLPEMGVPAQYAITIYWIITTVSTTGYGDITPGPIYEKMMTVLMMLAGSIMFASVIGSVSEFQADRKADMQREKMDSVSRFMRFQQLPTDLQIRMQAYYEHYLQRNLDFDEEEILSEMSSSLRSEVQLLMNRDLIERVPFFKGADTRFIVRIISALKRRCYAPGDIIMQEGEVAREMYLISQGAVNIVSNTGKILNTLHDGDFFGEIGILLQRKRIASAVAVNFCDLFFLAKEHVDFAMEEFPEVGRRVRSEAMRRLQLSKGTTPPAPSPAPAPAAAPTHIQV
mmetsp:Transcript_18147/g.30266  ORF Transcript_18147/g.30266 Transcript_18147/m.30266 type:complete len:582 (-) Transcript_18147:1749-3494(-)